MRRNIRKGGGPSSGNLYPLPLEQCLYRTTSAASGGKYAVSYAADSVCFFVVIITMASNAHAMTE